MIKLDFFRTKEHDLLASEALLRCLREQYRNAEYIIAEHKRLKAGYDGERNVDYKLATYPQKDFLIIPGIRLQNGPFNFQIDTLILTKKFICILEIKNQRGKFIYNSEQKQLTQEVNGVIKGYKDPILQVEAQKDHLKMWLERHGIFHIPIETFVVISYPTTIIENVCKDPIVYEKIIHRESLHQSLDKLNATYSTEILSKASVKKVHSTLLQENTPLKSDLLSKYGIKEEHLIKGIACTECSHFPLVHIFNNWRCPKCGHCNPKAHERLILDHFLLYNNTITNKECRQLLQFDSRRIIYHFLKSMKLRTTGNNRGQKYLSPRMSEFPQKSFIPIQKQTSNTGSTKSIELEMY